MTVFESSRAEVTWLESSLPAERSNAVIDYYNPLHSLLECHKAAQSDCRVNANIVFVNANIVFVNANIGFDQPYMASQARRLTSLSAPDPRYS